MDISYYTILIRVMLMCYDKYTPQVVQPQEGRENGLQIAQNI